MKVALVFDNGSQIWGEVISYQIGADSIELSLWEARKKAPDIELGKFVRVWDRLKDERLFEGYISKCTRDTVKIEKYFKKSEDTMDLSQAIQTARFQEQKIPGVVSKPLVTHTDERGFFREIIRVTDDFFAEGFGQWSHSMMATGTIKAWHYHLKQTDLFYIPLGIAKVVLCDINSYISEYHFFPLDNTFKLDFSEFILGDQHPAQVIRIPPGVAHGIKVLQGPAHLFYITSRVYDPADEGRIPYDALGYDWFKQEIK